jgi:hypothetical protein
MQLPHALRKKLLREVATGICTSPIPSMSTAACRGPSLKASPFSEWPGISLFSSFAGGDTSAKPVRANSASVQASGGGGAWWT